MPLVAYTNLPTFSRLQQEGEAVLTPERAAHQDIREMHVGLLNMMPDAALEATERQFFRLVGESNQIAQFYMHPFSLDEISRSDKAARHVAQYYESFEAIKEQGLDALIITGANVTQPNLSQEPFWEPLKEVVSWAYDNVTSTLCSCLATHAVLQFRYNQHRQRLPNKCWGVFNHNVVDRHHPLVKDVNTRFNVPHSRFNEISCSQFQAAGLPILAESDAAGVHLAVSEDGFRLVFMQGHAEYDSYSLLKEYKREVMLFVAGSRSTYPPFPTHYLSAQAEAILAEHRDRLCDALNNKHPVPEFPEALITKNLDNTWHDTGEAIINNWMGNVYQITNSDRRKPFMDGIDPNDPLGLRQSS
jgi:homoserine O-succinyltransferase